MVLIYSEEMIKVYTQTYDLSKHLVEFKELGYTVFKKVHGQDEIEVWKNTYSRLHHELFESSIGGRYIIPNMMEHAPKMMLRVKANPLILDFLEMVMGPFVQIGDSVIVGFESKPKEEASNKVNGWHRDRYSIIPNGNSYQIPRAVTALSYMHDLTEENGFLRVIPGSHRKEIILKEEEIFAPHPEEVVVTIQAGDKIVFHNSLLHTGSPNISGEHRVFIGGSYFPTWHKTLDNFNGPNVQQIIRDAREKNDLRLLRLFGVDEQLNERSNSGVRYPNVTSNEILWKEWSMKDKSALKT